MKIQGGYEITKAIGLPLREYPKVTSLLNLIEAPMEEMEKGLLAYSLTKKQVELLKGALRELKQQMKE